MSIRYTITFKNMINVYKMVRYSPMEKYVCFISIIFTKSFNLIPMSKKSTEFFQSVRFFPPVFVRIFEKVIWEHWITGGLNKFQQKSPKNSTHRMIVFFTSFVINHIRLLRQFTNALYSLFDWQISSQVVLPQLRKTYFYIFANFIFTI